MNAVQITGLLRIVVAMGMAPLIQKGYADDSMVEVIASSLVSLGLVVWSIWSHTQANQIKNVVDIHPDVAVVVPLAVVKADPAIKAMAQDPTQPQVLVKSSS